VHLAELRLLLLGVDRGQAEGGGKWTPEGKADDKLPCTLGILLANFLGHSVPCEHNNQISPPKAS